MPELAKIDECTGCAACYNACAHHALVMKPDREGFLYPAVDADKCVECNLCEHSCPILNTMPNTNATAPQAYAMWSYPDRTLSSSGGAFSAFARKTIEKGGVVYGAGFDEHLHLQHIGVTDIQGLGKLRGSKYVQSEIGEIFRQIKRQLQEGGEVLFCGTPCQVDGLRTYLHKDFNNLMLLDIACHGVPSDSVFQSYLHKLSKKLKTEIKDIVFRKLGGWDKQTCISTGEKCFSIYGRDNLYMEAFNKSAILRESCYHCNYAKVQRSGDCSLADFWGLGRHGVPFKHDVMKGVSLVLVNNEKGLRKLKELENTYIEERALEEALKENTNLKRASSLPSNRKEIIASFIDDNKTLVEIDLEYQIVDHRLKARIKNLALKWNIFQLVKRIYNLFKMHGYI